jgi:hypothetical protein
MKSSFLPLYNNQRKKKKEKKRKEKKRKEKKNKKLILNKDFKINYIITILVF